MSFNDKVVLVTGGSSGIGAAIAIKFAEEGARVAIVGRNQDKLNNVAKKCVNSLVLKADITKDDEAKRIVDETIRYFGKLDILVNNAGIIHSASIQSEDAMAVFDRVMTTNLRSVVYITHLAAPHLISAKGNIINISSAAGLRVISNKSFSYNTSKAALDHFSRSIALELASSGVRVNTVNPGPVYSDIVHNAGATKKEQAIFFEATKSTTALNRVSEPEEVADLVLFLASDKAKAITGASYVADNGWMLKTNEVNI